MSSKMSANEAQMVAASSPRSSNFLDTLEIKFASASVTDANGIRFKMAPSTS